MPAPATSRTWWRPGKGSCTPERPCHQSQSFRCARGSPPTSIGSRRERQALVASAASVNGRRWSQLLVALIPAAAAILLAMHPRGVDVAVHSPPQGGPVGNRYYACEKLTQRFAIHTSQVPTLRTLPPADGVL